MNNLLDPAILFFLFGVLAGTLRSNLEIPPAISRFLSLYLLMALGLKGGFALAHSGFTPAVAAGRLELLLEGHRRAEIGIHAVVSSTRGLPLRVRALVDYLARRFAQPAWRNTALLARPNPRSVNHEPR